jgi:CHAT domain-containing protein
VRDRFGASRDLAVQALRHPRLRSLSAFVAKTGGDRPVFLVPHRFLHALPLHLVADADGRLAPRPRTFHLPSASLLLYVSGYSDAAQEELVGGDPLGDLVFARLEAITTAKRFDSVATTGAGCTQTWLSNALDGAHGPRRLIHLACHAFFDPTSGERSGLVLSDENGEFASAVLPDLARLDWSCALAAVTACSSGQQQIRDGDELAGLARVLLARGAGALIAALWEVPDLPTYLVCRRLYENMPAEDAWTLDEIGRSLTAAQTTVRDMTARDLVSMAIHLRDEARTGGDATLMRSALLAGAAAYRAAEDPVEWMRWNDAAVKTDASGCPVGVPDDAWSTISSLAAGRSFSATPFADPIDWGAFVVLGCG